MDTYHVVLYIHFLALFMGIGAGTVLVVCLFQLRAARTAEEAAPWGRVAGKIARAFPLAILGLLGSGAYMTSEVWTWETGWIYVAVIALAVLTLQGPLVEGRLGKKVGRTLHANGPGALGPEALRMTRYFPLWAANLSALGLVLGIVWNMIEKPGTGTAVAAAVIGYAAGIVLAFPFTRMSAQESAPAREPAG